MEDQQIGPLGPEILAILYSLQAPKPGDILVLQHGPVLIMHHMHGPYNPEDIPEALERLCDEELVKGDIFNFRYEGLEGPEQSLEGGGIVLRDGSENLN